MPDIPPQQVQRRLDDSAADMGTLVDLGLAEEQPEPQYEGSSSSPTSRLLQRTPPEQAPSCLRAGGGALSCTGF